MFKAFANLAIAAPRRILAIAGLVLVAGVIFGAPVAGHLKAGGFTVPDADSSKANTLLDNDFGGGSANLLILISTKDGVDSPAAKAAATKITETLSTKPQWISNMTSYWTAPAEARGALLSKDGKQALVVAHVGGDDDQMQTRGRYFAEKFNTTGAKGDNPVKDGITIKSGGPAATYAAVTDQTTKDLTNSELISVPLTGIALVLVFGSLVAASVPLSIGIFSIVGTLAVLRGLASFTDVSIYAMNMTTALGLALAIDYSLLMVSRFREEIGNGSEVTEAVRTTVATAGRTVFFSALTVALSLAALAVFPLYFLRSFAYAGVAVVGLAALSSLVVLPAVLTLIGTKINSLRVRKIRDNVDLTQTTWYRLAMRVMRRPVIYGAAVVAVLLFLGSPFLRAEFGYPDDRVLTTSQAPRQVGDILREDFAINAASDLTGVSAKGGQDTAAVEAFTAKLQAVKGVESVRVMTNQDAVRWDVSSDVDPFSSAGVSLVRNLRDVGSPSDSPTHWTGWAAFNVDAIDGIANGLPWALGLIALTTFILLFLFTGSVVVPLKALVLNLFSLTATFGAMVWVFQDGHLHELLGFTPAGYLVVNMVVLMFCLAFGMSMDYEVFLLSRIREEWGKSDKTSEANTQAVAIGLARTGRLVTSAAVLMSVVFAAMIISRVQFMQLFGLGLTIAVLMDATLVRSILVPSFMRLMGRANWWAPRPLARLYERIGLKEE